jgi:hypothetical protein
MDADGDFVVAWDTSGTVSYGVYAQRYAVVPEVTSSAFLFGSSPHRLRVRFHHNVRDSRDGRVNLRDFNVLAHHSGHSGTGFVQGDFTYDGATDLEDFNLWATRFGMTLPRFATAPTWSASDDADEGHPLAVLS